MVSVTDRGCGLSPVVKEQLFTTKAEGMGMGLGICRSIEETHGGQSWAHSGPGGVGAVSSFSLPLEAGEPPEGASGAPARPAEVAS